MYREIAFKLTVISRMSQEEEDNEAEIKGTEWEKFVLRGDRDPK